MQHVESITVKKEENFGDWYQQVITKAKLIEYYDVSGCYVLLPNSYAIWENIQIYLDTELKRRGVKNVYFPLFITKRNLEKEKSHIEGFTPEVAWVTHTGSLEVEKNTNVNHDDNNNNETNDNVDGQVDGKVDSKVDGKVDSKVDGKVDSKVDGKVNDKVDSKADDKPCICKSKGRLETPIAIRPTSECAIYSIFPNLIQSINDLPLKYNQWCNVVRWEFKDPTPFIRSREFLWQEGHTCFSNIIDAMSEIDDIINLYKDTYEHMLSIPVIRGKKTQSERFSGALCTNTIEAYIPVVGKGIQAATAHCLSDNFSKMFNIKFQDTDGINKYVIQNSWGFTTRSIGIMLMVHGDNKGPIIPPRVANIQVVIIPIPVKNMTDEIDKYAKDVYDMLKNTYRVHIDTRNHNPGWKYNYWELMGVPIRLEVGPKDLKSHTAVLCRRDTGEKMTVSLNSLDSNISSLINNIHNSLLTRAQLSMAENIIASNDDTVIRDSFEHAKLCLISWCGDMKCEEIIASTYKVKSLCIPDDQIFSQYEANDYCLICRKETMHQCLFGRSF